MSLEQDLGQLLVVGFPEAPERAPDFILEALEAGEISGAILFRRNVDEIEQVISLCESLHGAVPSELPPPFVALDQEGGRVVRLREPLTRIPPMRIVGIDRNADRAARISEVVATEVATVGFNFNFAPVLDVDTNPEIPVDGVVGDRSFVDGDHTPVGLQTVRTHDRTHVPAAVVPEPGDWPTELFLCGPGGAKPERAVHSCLHRGAFRLGYCGQARYLQGEHHVSEVFRHWLRCGRRRRRPRRVPHQCGSTGEHETTGNEGNEAHHLVPSKPRATHTAG